MLAWTTHVNLFLVHTIRVVYRRQWQAVVHAGDVFVRGLLYDTTVLCIDISRSDMDRTEVPPSPTTDDGPWHPPVPQHSKDIELYSSRPTRIHLHFRMVDRCWHHSFGETIIFLCISDNYNIMPIILNLELLITEIIE